EIDHPLIFPGVRNGPFFCTFPVIFLCAFFQFFNDALFFNGINRTSNRKNVLIGFFSKFSLKKLNVEGPYHFCKTSLLPRNNCRYLSYLILTEAIRINCNQRRFKFSFDNHLVYCCLCLW